MKRDWFFWVTVGLTLAGIPILLYGYLQMAQMVEERLENLNTLQQGQLDLFQQRVSMLLTVGTLAIGGAGALLFHFHEKHTGSLAQHRLALLSIESAALSIVAGYLAFESAIWMLNKQFFNLETPVLTLLSDGQLWMSVFAVSALVLCFLAVQRPIKR